MPSKVQHCEWLKYVCSHIWDTATRCSSRVMHCVCKYGVSHNAFHSGKDAMFVVVLQTHVAAEHTGALNYLCEFCGKAFVRKDKLTDHVRRMHCASRAGDACKSRKIAPKFKPTVPPTEFERFIYKCRTVYVGLQTTWHVGESYGAPASGCKVTRRA